MLVAAIPNGLNLEFYRDTVSLPSVPGPGAKPNYRELEKYRVGKEVSPLPNPSP